MNLVQCNTQLASTLLATKPDRAFPAAELDGYAAEDLAFAAEAWRLKAEQEYVSAQVFAEMQAGLLDAGAPLDLLRALASITQDEIGHASLCLDLAKQLGARPAEHRPELMRDRLQGHADRRRMALSLLLIEGSIGETLSSALFHAGRQLTREPLARATLGAILRDEARHARVAWQGMCVMLPTLDQADREALQEELRLSMGSIERTQALPALQRLEAGEVVVPARVALGILPPEVRVETFYRTLTRTVSPRLNRLGFDADLAWANRYQPAAPGPASRSQP